MINILHNAGVSDKTINVIVIIMTAFFTFVGIALVGLGAYSVVNNVELPPWVTLGLGSIVSFMAIMLSSHQTTNQINGTAAKAASGAVDGMQPSISHMINMLAAAQPIAPQAPPVASSQVAAAVQENTQATQQNTEVMKDIEGEHHA